MHSGKDRPEAYEKLQFYKNICEIRKLINKLTERFARLYFRLISQMRDAARSAKQNIREGYAKDTVGEFAHSIKISRGSLSELEGDIDDCKEDGLMTEKDYCELKNLLRKTKFQMDRYIDSLYRLKKQGKWKTRFKK